LIPRFRYILPMYTKGGDLLMESPLDPILAIQAVLPLICQVLAFGYDDAHIFLCGINCL